MADGDEHDDGVAACRCCRWVYAGGHVDVETGLVRDEVLLEDAVEALFVVFSEEDVVCGEFGELAVQCPVKGYTRTRRFAFKQGTCIGRGR